MLGVRILVVDDDADAGELTAFVLSSSGAVVEHVSSAAEALQRIERERFDVVVSDISMPEMDGYALVDALRGKPGSPRTLALSSFTSEGDRAKALAAGFDGHVGKSSDAETLRCAVRTLMTPRDRTG